MLFNIKPLPPVSIPPVTFSGDFLSGVSGDQWEYAFLENGTITFTDAPGDCDIFLVANGKSGGSTNVLQGGLGEWFYYSGAGGDGGDFLVARATLEAGVPYTLSIGAKTTLTGSNLNLDTANGVAGKSGGRRGMCHVRQVVDWYGSIDQHPSAGKEGVFAYNDLFDTTIIPEFAGKKFSASGGGGDAFWYAGNLIETTDISGGSTGGGHGSWYRKTNGELDAGDATPGEENTGSGGGGGRIGFDGHETSSAAGGSGVCFIRKHVGG